MMIFNMIHLVIFAKWAFLPFISGPLVTTMVATSVHSSVLIYIF